MNTFEKKWKLFTLHILSFFFFSPLSTWIKTGREEETELHAEIFSLAAETHNPPKSSQASKLVNWTKFFPKALNRRGSQSRALPVSQQPGSQRTLWGHGEPGLKFTTLFRTKNEVLIARPQNIHSRVHHLSYWWHFLSYGVSVNSLDKKRRESGNGSVVALGSVTWEVHAAVSRTREI